MPLPAGFQIEEQQGSPTLPAGFSLESQSTASLPSGFVIEQPDIDVKKPNIFERAGNKFEAVKQNISTGFNNLVNEPSDQLTIPGDFARVAKSSAEALGRAKPLLDPNVSFPGVTAGRAGDISALDMFAPITRQVASSAGHSFSKGPIRGFVPGLAKSAMLGPAAIADTVGTAFTGLGDVIGNVVDVGDVLYKEHVLGQGRGRGLLDRFTEERLDPHGPSIGELTEARARPEVTEKTIQRLEEGMHPKVAQGLMVEELLRKGLGVDTARELAIQAIFLLTGRGIQKSQNAKLAAQSQALDTERRVLLGQEMLAGSGQKALPAPGPRPFGGRPQGNVAVEGPLGGKGFVIEQPGIGVKRPVGFRQPAKDIPGRKAAEPVKQVFGPRTAKETIDVKASTPKPKPPSREARLAEAAQAAKAAAAEEQAILNRAGVLREKNFPELKAKGLPPAKEGARPPKGQGLQEPIAGEGFVVDQPGALAKKFVPKQGAPRDFNKGGKELSLENKRRADAAALAAKEGPKRRSAVKNIFQAEFNKGQGKLPALPAPKKGAKAPLPVEGKVIPGKKFIVEPSAESTGITKAPRVRENIIEKAARKAVPKKERPKAIEQAGIFGKKIRPKKKSAPEKISKPISNTNISNKGKKGTLRDKRGSTQAFGEGGDPKKAGSLAARIAAAQSRLTVQEAAAVDDLARLAKGPDKGAAKDAVKKINNILRDKRGSAKAFGDKPKKSKAQQLREEIAAKEREVIKLRAAKAKREGKVPEGEKANIGELIDGKAAPVKHTTRKVKGKRQREEIGGDIEIERPVFVDAVDKAGKPFKKQVGGTKVGNTNVGKMVADGDISEREAKILVAVERANPGMADKFMQTTRAERIAAIGDPNVRKLLQTVEHSDPKSLAAFHDTPVSQALATIKRAQEQGIPIEHVMDDIAADLVLARKVAYLLGQNLQAIRRSAARGELKQILEARLAKGGLSKPEEKSLRESLAGLGSKKARTRFVRTMDMVTEYGINSMLSSPVTFARNLVGSAAGVASQIPVKIAQATISNIAAVLRIPQTERAYFREVGPEIAGMMAGFVRGLRKGKGFLKHEDVLKVIDDIDARVKNIASKEIPKGQSFSQLKRDQKARILRRLRSDMRDLLTEEEVTRAAELGFTTPTRSIPGKLGAIINAPVRGLVATDKVFQTTSAHGHIAARRVRKAIQTGQKVKDIRLSAAEIEEAKNDAMFYVFREKLGPKLGSVQNLISDTPIMPLIIPFLKSRINFVKFGLKNSPFGAVDTIIKSTKAKALDTKSAARALSGTAVIFGMDLFFEKNKDNIEIQPAAGSQAERATRRESGIGEQVIVFGTNLQDPKKRKVTHVEPYANTAPFSGPLEVIGLKQEYYRRLAKGQRGDEAFAATINKAMKGVWNQSAFGSVKDTVRAMENIGDTKVALKADGTPEHGPIASMLRGPVAQVFNKKIAGVAVPNIVRDVTKIFDKRILDPKTLGERLRADLPIAALKKDIPARKTVFGTDAVRTQKRFPNPFIKTKIDDVAAEMVRLEIFPARTPKQLSQDKLKIVLTEDEQRQYNSLGKELKQNMKSIMAQDWYKESSDFVRATVLEAAIDEVRKMQTAITKSEALLRLIQSPEGFEQMFTGVTKGRSLD
jgi:hypothetical protein